MALHPYGGRHTERDKLRPLGEYLQAYVTALKHQPFDLIYVDAFAGTGARNILRSASPLLDGAEAPERYITKPGSARIALAVKPPLRRLIFIEQHARRYAALQKLSEEWPDRNIMCCRGDANAIVRELCATTSWRTTRAVMFLDPYGMEVDWETLEAIARTEAVDLWYFFPLMGLYRQAARDPAGIDAIKRAKLNRLLGTNEWEQAWYLPDPPNRQSSLFDQDGGGGPDRHRAHLDALEVWVRDRLRTIFSGAVLKPRRIYNDRGAPLASLFFAVANPNPKAAGIASKIAAHILSSGNSSQVRSR